MRFQLFARLLPQSPPRALARPGAWPRGPVRAPVLGPVLDPVLGPVLGLALPLALTVALTVTLTLALPAPASAQNWFDAASKTERGHLLGNPQAANRLIAFVSYTCPVCERFERESEGALRMIFIAGGNLALEIRPEIHSPVDLALSLAAACGPVENFFANHRAIYAAQGQILAKLRASTEGQRARWFAGTQSQRMSAIAADIDLFELFATRGYSFPQLSRCLADTSAATAILANEAANGRDFGVAGTPSFAFNGALLADVHSWQALEPIVTQAAQ